MKSTVLQGEYGKLMNMNLKYKIVFEPLYTIYIRNELCFPGIEV